MDTKTNPSSKLVAIKTLAFASALALASALSSCSTAGHVGDGIAIAGSPEAVSRFFDGQNALVTNGKASADTQDTPAYQLRRHQVQASVIRFTGAPKQEAK